MIDPADLLVDDAALLEGWEQPEFPRLGWPGVDSGAFRAIMGSFPSGVAVVTARNQRGEPRGMTVTACASVSLDPPLLLVCLATGAATRVAVTRTGVFAVNFLRSGQEAIAARFSQRRPDKFEQVPVRLGRLGVPLIVGALAVAECRVVREVPAGDHIVVIGAVAHGEADKGDPLVYHRRTYGRLASALPVAPVDDLRTAG